jgi:hypothetical protein
MSRKAVINPEYLQNIQCCGRGSKSVPSIREVRHVNTKLRFIWKLHVKDWFMDLFVLKSCSILFIRRFFVYFSSWKSKMKFLRNSTLCAIISVGPLHPPPRSAVGKPNLFLRNMVLCSVFEGSSNAIICNFLQSVITRRRTVEIVRRQWNEYHLLFYPEIVYGDVS